MLWLAKKNNGIERDPKEFWIPERRLLAAILHRAVNDYTGPDPRLAEEAGEWLFEEVIEPYQVLTFAWICEQLELDADMISSAITSLPRRERFPGETVELRVGTGGRSK